MEYHHWVLIQRDGEIFSGVDDYPNEMLKLNARTLIFDTPHSPEIEIHVPPGHILIFKRRTRIERNFETGEEVRSWRYILGSEPMAQENEAVSPMVTPRTG